MKNKLTLTLTIILALAVSCKKKKNDTTEPNTTPKPITAYSFFPNNNNTKWIFEVSKISAGMPVYLYDDTLIFVKDTLININANSITYKNYKFIHGTPFQNYLFANYPNNTNNMSICLNYHNFNLYNTDSIDMTKPTQPFRHYGGNIDSIYFTEYTSKTEFLQTQLGTLEIIKPRIIYSTKVGDRYIDASSVFKFGKDVGMVYLNYSYKKYKDLFTIDSSVALYYNIKKVVN